MFSVKFIENVGEPPAFVPVTVATVLVGLGPPPLEPLPPLQAAIVTARAKTTAARAMLHRVCFPRPLRSRMEANNPSASAIAPLVFHEAKPLGRFAGVIAAAVVAIVTATGTLVVVALSAAELGLKLQDAPVGSPAHAKLTVPVNPLTPKAVKFSVPEPPALAMLTTGFDDER